MSDFEKLVEELDYDSMNYEGIVDYSEQHRYIDVDRVNVRLHHALDYGFTVWKVKEDINHENDDVVRVYFREIEIDIEVN